ncbi:endo-1,4-beta-xylanase [Rubrivirga sp.]|uniref:endo-1,4-beta-xylanase n=1 Tax=Rubrivirga sp. TaxID=1885344 RepID=UPI003B51551B
MGALEWAYASTPDGDPYMSPISVTSEGVSLPQSMASRPFAVNAQWYVEGFGNVWLEADNQGRYFTADDFRGPRVRNLNVEFARSTVARNAATIGQYVGQGTAFSAEVRGLHDLSQELLEDASRQSGETAGETANQALLYALWAGEKAELEHARSVLATPRTGEFHFGCETRQYIWAKSETMQERFVDAFNFATVTHYIWDTWYPVFEPREGVYRWGLKDDIVDWLVDHDITIEGRPLVWFHPAVTPDWLAQKDFPALKGYVENHARELVGHYGDKVLHWEVVNEYHDWANVHDLTPDQITEVVRLACEVTHDTNPRVDRLINNCCPYGEYASYGHAAHGEADRPLRTPRQFVADLVEAEVPFETVGVQMYFPNRSLADIVRHVDRFAAFGKPVYISEIGASSGPTEAALFADRMELTGALYDWHRPWDPDLQADWLEQLYTVFYARPYVHALNWYDFADFRTFIQNGGLVNEDASPKPSYERLRGLLAEWNRLPE